MKLGKLVLTGFATLSAIILFQSQAQAKKGGTSILHIMVRATMSGTTADAGATGSVRAKQNQQGNANNQRLEIVVANLDSNTTYALLAATTDDENLHDVTTIDTDSNGRAHVKYVKKNNGNASPGGGPLPDGLDPISKIRGLAISADGSNDVLTADLSNPNKLQYLVKRPLTNDAHSGATATLRIKATTSVAQLRIRASGLAATSTYYLAINGEVAESLTSNAKGRLNATGFPNGSPDVLDIRSLAILDSASNSVLSTPLP